MSHLEDILIIIAFHHVVLLGRSDEVGLLSVSLQSEVIFVSIADTLLISAENEPKVRDFIVVGVVCN